MYVLWSLGRVVSETKQEETKAHTTAREQLRKKFINTPLARI
jgi:hypothetical protein